MEFFCFSLKKGKPVLFKKTEKPGFFSTLAITLLQTYSQIIYFGNSIKTIHFYFKQIYKIKQRITMNNASTLLLQKFL